MEDIHGVDVSWLHRSHKGEHKLKPPSKPSTRESSPAPSPQARDSPATNKPLPQPTEAKPAPVEKTEPAASPKPPARRPGILGRSVSDRSGKTAAGSEDPKSSRRPSWMSSLSSKFSSSQNAQSTNTAATPNATNGLPSPPLTPTKSQPITVTHKSTAGQLAEAVDEDGSNSSADQQKGSFFTSALRRLSSSGPPVPSKASTSGSICPRRVLNIDKERERCDIKELNLTKLRKVAFSVDVEIAGYSRQESEPKDADDKKKKNKEKKLKERAEGQALKKHLDAADENDDDEDEFPHPYENAIPAIASQGDAPKDEPQVDEQVDIEAQQELMAKKEKRRKKAEDAGSIPKEIDPEADEPAATPSADGKKHHHSHDIPTIDPQRVYRRCCQLRGAPALKRISEQLGNPVPGSSPGVVGTLDLRGSRMQLPDVVVLSDCLAIVPVQKLLLDDANLTDEGVRVLLAGLLAVAMPEPAKRKRTKSSPSRVRKKPPRRQHGIIEKLTLKNNPKITREGWMHICLFVNMSRTLKALDVSLIPFPQMPESTAVNGSNAQIDVSDLLSKAISERRGTEFEELLLGECRLQAPQVGKIVDAVIKIGLRRLGLAGNRLDEEGLQHAARYIKSGVCQGIDLGDNDLRGKLHIIGEALDPSNHLVALSIADCNLDPSSLNPLFPELVTLPAFRFIDLSHNHDLFSTSPSALGTLRKYLPKLNMLRRIHLCDVSMSSAQAIGLSEVLPESRNLNHLNILDNPALKALSVATDEAGQEEACALYASLMAAVRVSKTILAVDIEVPSPDTSDVVKALAKQVVAYCLRNMERFTAAEAIKHLDSAAYLPDWNLEDGQVETPDVLLHLIGHADGDSGPHDFDPPAPDDDYLVGGQGVVKALRHCLDQKDLDVRRLSVAPGAEDMGSEEEQAKAKKMSTNLLGSARKIRKRLEPAIAQELKNGDEIAFRRLLFLDETLKGMIERFEEEYPETRVAPEPTGTRTPVEGSAIFPVKGPDPLVKATVGTEPTLDPQDGEAIDDEVEERPYVGPRRASDVSLASRALGIEEGRMHRLSQRVRREILEPQGLVHGNGPMSEEQSEPEHLAALRTKLESIGGDEMREQILTDGYDNTVKLFTEDVEHMAHMRENYPEEFRKFREAQLAAQSTLTPAEKAAREAETPLLR